MSSSTNPRRRHQLRTVPPRMLELEPPDGRIGPGEGDSAGRSTPCMRQRAVSIPRRLTHLIIQSHFPRTASHCSPCCCCSMQFRAGYRHADLSGLTLVPTSAGRLAGWQAGRQAGRRQTRALKSGKHDRTDYQRGYGVEQHLRVRRHDESLHLPWTRLP